MTEREKVIKAFEFCLMPASREELENDVCSHEDCPYYREYNGGKCVSAAAADALALLKAQEPRVMTLIEWIRATEPADGECMCYEIKDEGLQAMLVKAFDGVRHLYGKAFRCWTSRPTDEQMEAIPWMT